MIPFLDFLELNRLPYNSLRRLKLKKKKATKFVVLKDVLYRQSMDDILFRYIINHETHEAMSEVHFNIGDAHHSGSKLYMQFNRLGYY